jgi:hypothetical protein
LPYFVPKQPIGFEKVDIDVTRPLPDFSLVPQDTLCSSHEFFLGLSLLTEFYKSSVYNFGEWTRALAIAYELAEAEVR